MEKKSRHLIAGPITSTPRPLSYLALSYVALVTFLFLTFLFRIRSFPISLSYFALSYFAETSAKSMCPTPRSIAVRCAARGAATLQIPVGQVHT